MRNARDPSAVSESSDRTATVAAAAGAAVRYRRAGRSYIRLWSYLGHVTPAVYRHLRAVAPQRAAKSGGGAPPLSAQPQATPALRGPGA